MIDQHCCSVNLPATHPPAPTPSNPLPSLRLVTYGLLAAVVWAGAALTSIWEPLVLIGSTAGALVTLVFPGVLALGMPEVLTDAPGARAGRVLGGVVLVAVGLAVGAGGVFRVLLYRSPLGGA
jgi:hypothetical protein